MVEETWRPLGVDTEEQVAEYDALHDDVPDWMDAAFWSWVKDTITVRRCYYDGSGNFAMVNEALVEAMCQTLRIALPDIRPWEISGSVGLDQFKKVMPTLRRADKSLAIADYLLAHEDRANSEELEALLTRAKSAWTVGSRAGRPGLVRRVPSGVQDAADSVMDRTGRAGIRLAKAWEQLYGIQPNASAAYGLAIKAVEDAIVPVVSPTNERATLGTVLAQVEQQADWKLPMEREHDRAPSREVLIGMMRLLWHGQHDRHGGQPSAPGDVSIEEATVAVSLAVTLVNVLHAGLVSRESAS